MKKEEEGTQLEVFYNMCGSNKRRQMNENDESLSDARFSTESPWEVNGFRNDVVIIL